MSAQSDGVLLGRYASSRDDADFRPLVERYAAIVYGACLARLGRCELAEDAAQAVFLLLATKAPKMHVPTTLAPWLLAACRNVSMRLDRSERRRERRERPLDETLKAPTPHDEVGAIEAIERLRGVERDAIVLRFVHDRSFAEVGAQLGLSEDAARMRVQRALTRLRREIAPLAAVPPSLVDRLARPRAAPASITKLATQGSKMNPTSLAFLVSAGVALTLGAASHAPQTASAAPPATSPVPVAAFPSQRIPSRSLTTSQNAPKTPPKGRRLRFEEYLGKDQAWFQKRFGPPDGGLGLGGGRTGETAPLKWTTYDRRPDLGGGRWQMASAVYGIGEDPQTPMLKVLSVTFECPVGGRPVAVRVDHGVDPKPPRTFEEEAAYVGVDLADYEEATPDRSNAEDRRLVNRKDPAIVLTANNLNDTWHIGLQIDPKSRG